MKLTSIKLQSNRLSETVRFYSSILAKKPLRRSGKDAAFVMGHTTLTFTSTELKPVYHIAFNIPCNQLHAGIEYLSQKTKLISPYGGSPIVDFKNWNAESVYFHDCNNNICELIARRDLQNQSEAAFDGRSLLYVSEIGVVVPSVSECVRTLREQHGILPYEKQSVLGNFAALGNPEGLLILSTPARKWFPTDTVAERYPLEVSFSDFSRKATLSF
jgi:catechol-2,3-dioxygenase